MRLVRADRIPADSSREHCLAFDPRGFAFQEDSVMGNAEL